jgi:hypothetical protein
VGGGEVSKGRDLRDLDGNPLSITRYLSGKENMVATITRTLWTDGEASRAKDRINYHIRRIPDGLSVEKFYHSENSNDSFTRLPRDPEAATEAIASKLAELDEMIIAQQQEREMGLTFTSEKDIKEITELIQGAQPSPYEREDVKFLRQEQHAKSLEGKTRGDEVGRETDIAKAEFMAHAMNLDMTKVVGDALSPQTSQDMIAKLEAQAERKAIQAKAAYELGVRSLAEVFGKDSREGMAEQGWRFLTNESRSPSVYGDFDSVAYLAGLSRDFGDKNLIVKPAYDIYDNPLPSMVGIFVKQDAWENRKGLQR